MKYRFILLFFLFNWQALQAATFSSNQTGNWNAPSIWVLIIGTDADGIPDADDDASISMNNTVTLNDARGCESLTIHGTLTMSASGSLDNNGLTVVEVGGTLNLSGGSLDFTQPFTINGTCNVTSTYSLGTGVSIGGTGTFSVNSGGNVTFGSGATLTSKLATSSSGVVNDNVGLSPGVVTMANGTYQGTGSPTFANGFNWSQGILAGSGTVAVSGTMTGTTTLSKSVQGSKELILSGAATLNNSGINLAAGTKLTIPNGGSLSLELPSSTGTFGGAATALVELQAGGAFTKTGPGQTDFNCEFKMTGGTLTISQGTFNLISSATHTFSGGSVSLDAAGVLRVGATTNFSNIAISGAGTFTNASGITSNFNTGSSLTCKMSLNGTINDNVGLQPGEVTMLATYQGTGSPTFANGFIWNGGTFGGSGTVTVSGSFSSPSGNRVMADSKELRISGAAVLNTTSNSTITMNGTSKITVTPTGSLTFDGLSLTFSGVAATLFSVENGGDIIKNGTGTTSFSCPVSFPAGTSITVNNGPLNLSGGFTYAVTGASISLTSPGSFGVSSSTCNFSNTAISGTGSLSQTSGTTNMNAGTTLTSNLSISGGTFNDNVSLSPGGLTISGGTYQGSGAPSIFNLTLSNGTFDPGGSATIAGALTWTDGTIGSSGGTASTVDVAGAATISGTGSKSFVKKTLNLNGGGSWTGGSITVSNSAVLNLPGGQALGFDLATNLLIFASGAGGTLNIAGDLTKTGAGTATVSAALNNTGSVAVTGGVLALGGSGTHTGTFSTGTALGLQFNGGTHGLTGPAITGGGSLRVAGTVTMTADLGRPLTMAGGSFGGAWNTSTTTIDQSGGTFNPSGTVALTGNLTVSGGTFGPGGTATVGGGLTLSNGTFDPGGSATIAGALTWTDGTIGSSGGTASTVDVAGAATISGTGSKSFVKKTLNLNGGGSWTGGSITVSNSAVLNLPGGQQLAFDLAASATIFTSGAGGTLNIAGDLTKTGAGTATVSVALNNTGTIHLQQGILDVNGAFTQSGTVKGVGTLDVTGLSWNNTGIFSPGNSPGILPLTGIFANNGGSLDIEIGGTTVGTEYDRLVITGTATLNGAGAINLTLVNGYTPQVGHSFTILDAVSMNGTFATPTDPFVFEGYNWGIAYNNAQGTITLSVLSLLPVELTGFSGKQEGDGALLTWRTASEQDNEGFFVEKSTDGGRFEDIGFVAGAGTSFTENSYEFLDRDFATSAFYRLRQMDFDGSFSFSKTIAVQWEGGSEMLFHLFPNPAAESITLEFLSPSETNLSIRITDVTGRLVLAEHLQATKGIFTKTLDVSNLRAGIYFLELRDGERRELRRVLRQ